MAPRRGGLGKGLDSLIPKKLKRIEFDEQDDIDLKDKGTESESEKQEAVSIEDESINIEKNDEEDLEIDDEINPFALDDDDDDDIYEEDDEEADFIESESEDVNEDTASSADANQENHVEEKDADTDSFQEKSQEEKDTAFSEEIEFVENNSSEEMSNEKNISDDRIKAEQEEQQGFSKEEFFTEDSTKRITYVEDSSKENISIKDSSNQEMQFDSDETNAVIMMRTSLVEPNREQPRKKFNDATIEELAESIRLYGVIQPLLVQKREDYYEIVAGERRWRAAKKAGLKEIPVIVRDYSTQEAAEISLIENIQREDLNPIEEAQAYDRLIREFSMTQEEVASKVARSRSAITNSLRLLRLCEDVRDMVIRGDISEGHARAILALSSPGHQKMLAEQVVNDKLSVRETERIIRKILKPPKETKESSKDVEREAALSKLSENLTHAFGTRVQISGNAKGKGKIEIEFYSDEELERIYEMLQSIR